LTWGEMEPVKRLRMQRNELVMRSLYPLTRDRAKESTVASLTFTNASQRRISEVSS